MIAVNCFNKVTNRSLPVQVVLDLYVLKKNSTARLAYIEKVQGIFTVHLMIRTRD